VKCYARIEKAQPDGTVLVSQCPLPPLHQEPHEWPVEGAASGPMRGNTEPLERQARTDTIKYLEEIQAHRLALIKSRHATPRECDDWLEEVERIDTLIDWLGGDPRARIVDPTQAPRPTEEPRPRDPSEGAEGGAVAPAAAPVATYTEDKVSPGGPTVAMEFACPSLDDGDEGPAYQWGPEDG
jgi:hypothetical protein